MRNHNKTGLRKLPRRDRLSVAEFRRIFRLDSEHDRDEPAAESEAGTLAGGTTRHANTDEPTNDFNSRRDDHEHNTEVTTGSPSGVTARIKGG